MDIIYASPETLVGDPEWRASIQKLPVSVLVIDEFHTIATWGDDGESQGKETFRKWFNDIGELRSLYPRSSVLALSATCAIKIRKRVMKVLHLADNFKEIVISPNKTNIRISVAKVSNTVETAMHWLIEGLSELKEKFPRTIFLLHLDKGCLRNLFMLQRNYLSLQLYLKCFILKPHRPKNKKSWKV